MDQTGLESLSSKSAFLKERLRGPAGSSVFTLCPLIQGVCFTIPRSSVGSAKTITPAWGGAETPLGLHVILLNYKSVFASIGFCLLFEKSHWHFEEQEGRWGP